MQEKNLSIRTPKGAFALSALFAGIVLASGCGSDNTPGQARSTAGVCSEVATEQQARSLIDRMVPDAKYIEVAPLNQGSTSCLLEVEVQIDPDNPESRGFFYVLPNGEYGLNGPLIDKRAAALMASVNNQQSQDSDGAGEIADALARLQSQVENARAGVAPVAAPAQAPEPTEPPAIVQTPQGPVDANSPFVAEPGKTLQQTVFAEMKKLDYASNVQTVEIENPVAQVYVLYDSTCPFCAKLFKAQDELAEKHNIVFNWVPGYINNTGWIHAAHAIKELHKSNEAGVAAIREAFAGNRQLTPDQLKELAENMTEQDFENAMGAAVFLYRLNKTARSSIGTPLIYVEGPNGNVSSASGAITKDSEWQGLLEKATQ